MRSFFYRWLLPRLGELLIRGIGSTLRWRHCEIPKMEELSARHTNVIYAFWHNRLVLMPHFYVLGRRRRSLAVMVSQSRDGQIISDIIERFGFKAVRGSTTRGGKAALREMVKVLKSGFDAAFTPDGPRGPRYEVSPGVVVLSHLTGLLIVPACFDASHKITLNSWDKMIIPLPFSRAIFRLGDPITVGRDINPNVLEEKILEVKTALTRLSDQCALELTRNSG